MKYVVIQKMSLSGAAVAEDTDEGRWICRCGKLSDAQAICDALNLREIAGRGAWTMKPKKCECKGSAIRTLLDVSPTHYKCPRCGGLIPKKRIGATGQEMNDEQV